VDDVVTYRLEDRIAMIGLNRINKRNAMDERVYLELDAAVRRAWDEARAGILFGHGEHFSAGLDLNVLVNPNPDPDLRRRFLRCDPHRAIDRGEIPFVAALSGAVIGAGLELAASAHIRVADETAFFRLPEAQRGIFLGGGGSVRIPQLIGLSAAIDMMLTGRTMDANEAKHRNLVQYIVPKGDALSQAVAIATQIATNSADSNRQIVQTLPRLGALPYDDGLYFEHPRMPASLRSDAVERVSHFLHGREKGPGN
jgi:enoyl-CoA hydratase/carnithine racemase